MRIVATLGSTEHSMTPQATPSDSPTAMAQVLAMIMASHSRLDERELRLLEGLDAFKRIGVSEAEFLRIAKQLRHGAFQALPYRAWLHIDDLEAVDAILDGVRDRGHRLLLCRLAACAITADGRVESLERTLYERMLLRWGHTTSSVAQAILEEHVQ
jgi:hypothetical protein